MKITQIPKLIWRNLLAIQEAKETFFRGIEKLTNSKKYDSLFRKGQEQGVEVLYYNSEKDLLYLKTKEGIVVETNNDYGTFLEIFINKEYLLPPQINKAFCVFDVGMNRGYTSLFFADYEDCKEIFGFELDPKTYEWALRNFSLNAELASKVIPYDFGLWDEDQEIEIRYRDSDGCTTVDSLVSKYPRMTQLFENKEYKIKKAKVKKASTQFLPILEKIPADRMKILKIDIEGAEYAVFADLFNHGILNQFDLIMGECHNGIAGLEEYLHDFTCIHKSKSQGLFFNFAYINNKMEQ